jgi:hypothetical protein
MTIEVGGGKIRLQGNMKVVVEAPQIELVESSTHPLVYGDDLLQYLTTLVTTFNSHIHQDRLGRRYCDNNAHNDGRLTSQVRGSCQQK